MADIQDQIDDARLMSIWQLMKERSEFKGARSPNAGEQQKDRVTILALNVAEQFESLWDASRHEKHRIAIMAFHIDRLLRQAFADGCKKARRKDDDEEEEW